MKLNKLILPAIIGLLTLNSCEDQKMEWGRPDEYGDVNISEIPLELAEKLANYDFIKTYAAKHTPNMTIGIGLGADLYVDDEAYRKVADENFQMITTGNAMKHSSVVNSRGELNFTTIDKFFNALPPDMKVYGHTLAWHSQQQTAYLNTLIAPTIIIEPDPGNNIENVIQNSDFEAGNINEWGAWSSGGCTAELSESGKGYNSNYAMKLTNPAAAGEPYSAQAYYTLPTMLWEVGETYVYSAYVYSEEGNPKFQMQLQNRSSYDGGIWKDDPVPAGQWYLFEKEFVLTQDVVDKNISHLTINFGAVTGVTYIDNIQFGKKKAVTRSMPETRGIIEIPKTDEEKKALITGAMESWIKGMMDHCKDRVTMWDVLNEPVDDASQLRGVDGNIPSTIGNQEFYWGQYMGKEYAVKAFRFARQYGNPDDKLFINDYNLEVNPSKLRALIDYVNYIDEQNGSPIVDGIGTQMHVIASSITRKEVDDMFKTMAATGKLIRITELDVRINTTSPSADQLKLQAETYQMVVDSYKENVPEAQQSGITIWTLTDHPREHEYWFPDDAPNLFDKNYGRKHAYKGFCDGLAGYDISTDFSGDDWASTW